MLNHWVDELYNFKTLQESMQFVNKFREHFLNKNLPLKDRKETIKLVLESAESHFRSAYISQCAFNHKKYYISKNKPILDMLTLFLCAGGISPTLKQLDYLTALWIDTASQYTESHGVSIQVSSIENILNQAKGRKTIEFINDRLSSKLKIIPLQAVHSEFNAIYYPYFHSIFSSILRIENEDEHYIFLHELGHALQIAITKDPGKIPESFYSVFERTFHNNVENVPPQNFPDIFADCYSVYYSSGTEYEKTNPFIRLFDPDDVNEICCYFEKIINL